MFFLGQGPRRLIAQQDKSILFRLAASTQHNSENTYAWNTITKYQQPHISALRMPNLWSRVNGPGKTGPRVPSPIKSVGSCEVTSDLRRIFGVQSISSDYSEYFTYLKVLSSILRLVLPTSHLLGKVFSANMRSSSGTIKFYGLLMDTAVALRSPSSCGILVRIG
jgi:hypothetical protein